MRVIAAKNVNDAWALGLELIEREGVRRPSRNGDVLVHPSPVTTVYSHPTQRVLLDPVRDANPIFHLMESLWMLSGRDDATWLDQFVASFSTRYGEKGGVMHGAYGKRWRDWFYDPLATQGENGLRYDQLDAVVHLLKKDPYDRQCVIQMWDAESDLGVPGLLDRPCNTQIYLRCDRTVVAKLESSTRLLDMTVTCRSNDIVFGCYGANAVHMSVLQEYLAARIGVAVGRYYQVSNNWHLYESSRAQASLRSAIDWSQKPYPSTQPLVDDPSSFDEELEWFMDWTTIASTEELDEALKPLRNKFLSQTAAHMYLANRLRKNGDINAALSEVHAVRADDWRQATVAWLARRQK